MATLSPLPEAIISDLPKDRIIFRSSCAIIDPGVVQSDPVTINPEKTWELQFNFINRTLAAAIQEEVILLKKETFDLCIVDATPFPALASKMLGIPTILITNFTFDSIFHYLCEKCGDSITNDKSYDFNKIVKRYEDAYKLIDGLLYLPGQIPIRSFDQERLIEEAKDWDKSFRFIMNLPIVHRPLQLSSKETRKRLFGLEESTPLLLICFGSWNPSLKEKWNIDDLLPSDWHAVSLSPLPISHPRVHILPQSTYMPDLVNASTLVLGKCGYGLCSEVVGFSTPLLYIRRPLFLEEDGLIKLLEDHQLGKEMSINQYQQGKWKVPIQECLRSCKKNSKKIELVGKESEGVLRASKIINELLQIYPNKHNQNEQK